MAIANLNTNDFIKGDGVSQAGRVITISSDLSLLDFDFNYFNYIFTDPVSYNLYINEMELGSFTAPSPFDVEMGTF